MQSDVILGGEALGDGELSAADDGRLYEHAAEGDEVLVGSRGVEVEGAGLCRRVRRSEKMLSKSRKRRLTFSRVVTTT